MSDTPASYTDTSVIAGLPFAGSLAVNKNDLVFRADADNNFYPASSMPDQGSAAANQLYFASRFAGVSNQRYLAAQTPTTIDVKTVVALTLPCPSQTWKAGDLVGACENGTTNGILSGSVDRVTDPNKAIGRVIRAEPAAVTQVLVILTSNVFSASNGSIPFSQVASASQAAATDAASTQTLANALRSALVTVGLIKGSA